MTKKVWEFAFLSEFHALLLLGRERYMSPPTHWPPFSPSSIAGSFPLRAFALVNPSAWQGFSGGSEGQESAGNVGDLGSISGLGRSPGGGHGNPFQYSCLENTHGQSLVGYSPWGHKESDTTEWLSTLLGKLFLWYPSGVFLNVLFSWEFFRPLGFKLQLPLPTILPVFHLSFTHLACYILYSVFSSIVSLPRT